jgi:hypothetical protein
MGFGEKYGWKKHVLLSYVKKHEGGLRGTGREERFLVIRLGGIAIRADEKRVG